MEALGTRKLQRPRAASPTETLPRWAVPVLVLLLAGCAAPPPPTAPPGPDPSDATFDGVRFDTDLGPITAIFFPEDAPETVALYKAYLQEGYFDGRAFGRVVPGHVIQVTDAGGLGATEDRRTVPLEASPRLNFSAGALGVARGEDPHSGGPEFFVMDYATSHLWGNFTVFGQVVEGLDVVRAIARVPSVASPPAAAAVAPFDRMALQPVTIRSAAAVGVTLDGAEAAHVPARVGLNVRMENHRHSLEWPADLAPGKASTLTWYIRPYNESASLAPSSLALRVEGPGGLAQVPLEPQADNPQILRWRWAPPARGDYAVTVAQAGRDLATIHVLV